MKTKDEIFESMIKDESKVPPYSVESVLELDNGCKITTPHEWLVSKRPYLLQQFREIMYGDIPPRPDMLQFELLSINANALEGKAVRKEIRIHCAMQNGNKHFFDMLLYIPSNSKKPSPAFLGLNFKGNHTCTSEEDIQISLPPSFRENSEEKDIPPRGENKDRWCFEEVISRGYASATIYYEQLFPDHKNGMKDSIYKLFLAPEQLSGKEHDSGAISAWAWGVSRALDCLEAEPLVDSTKVTVLGHSRLGKTALWAGACDRRFAMVISNASGCCGAALSKRIFGENIAWILFCRTYWFNKRLLDYCDNEATLPFDQNHLLALIAPRPLYVASATEDQHADPKGECLSLIHAAEAYRLFGCKNVVSGGMPEPDTSIGEVTGYHIRTGKHELTQFDWMQFLDFADNNLLNR